MSIQAQIDRISDEVGNQSDLIERIKTALNGKAVGGGGDGSDKFDASLDGSLTEVNSDVSIVTTQACRELKNIITVNLPNATSIGSYAFYQCKGILDVNLPKANTISASAFYQCEAMKKLDCGQSPSFGSSSLAYCNALTTLIIRGTTKVASLNSSAFSGVSNLKAYIYVPAALIEDYKTAANWSTYASKFRAIEDYPEICGG